MYVCINHDLIRNQLRRNLNILVCLFPIKLHVDGQTSSSPEYKSQLFLSPFLLLVADGQPALFPQTLHFFSCHYYQTLLLKSWVNLVQCTTRQVFSAIFLGYVERWTLHDSYTAINLPLLVDIAGAPLAPWKRTNMADCRTDGKQSWECLHKTR